jgi:hypothetical protein
LLKQIYAKAVIFCTDLHTQKNIFCWFTLQVFQACQKDAFFIWYLRLIRKDNLQV